MQVIKFDLDILKNMDTGFAYYILGRSYDLEENGAEEDLAKAFEYYMKGYKLNYPLCTYSLGISYYLGLGNIMPVDKEKANILLNEAYPKIQAMINDETLSKEERLYAKFVTAAYYNWGLGSIKKDDNMAFNIIKECANDGHIPAMYDLGYKFYHDGIGVRKDILLSKKYLKMAKDLGLKRAIDKYSEYKYDEQEI